MQKSKSGGKGCGSKSSKNPGAASRKAKRQRSHHKLLKKKDRNVERSSHGHFKSVAELVTHEAKVTPSFKTRKATRETTHLHR